MTFAPVGIRCPDHANVGGTAPRPAATVRSCRRQAGALDNPVTVVLIAINVARLRDHGGAGRRRSPAPAEQLFEDMG